MTVSPKVRLLALAGLVGAVALGAGVLLLSKHQSSSSAATPTIHPLYPHRHHHRTAHAGKPVVKRPVTTLHPAAKAKPRRVHRSAVVDGMPAALASSLASHEVVVVALYAPHSSVDQLATAEARAGAADAGAGFVSVNVLNERQSRALTRFLATVSSPNDRILDDPAVLVFQQPKTLFIRLSGFADRETVAQAAQNAAPLAAASR